MRRQPLASYPGTKSPTVGTSGNNFKRVAVVTANGRSLPALMCSIDALTLSIITCTYPAIRSVSAGDAPRYGTCTMLVLVIILNSSPATWGGVPLPPEPKLTLPGLAATDRPAPSRPVTPSAARQRPRPYARMCGGEVSLLGFPSPT